MPASLTPAAIEKLVAKTLREQPIVDMHTHLYSPAFGTPVANNGGRGKTDPTGLLLYGLDELLTYHYLIAEVFRVVPATKGGGLSYEAFWKMPKSAQADHIFKHLFVERTPISESCRGVLTSLQLLGLDISKESKTGDLSKLRKWFTALDPDAYIDQVMRLSGVSSITMTNAVFDDNERSRWLADPKPLRADSRFKPVLRIDPILCDWPAAARKLAEWGYHAGDGTTLTPANIDAGKKFLADWIDRQGAIYVALSLPPEFRYPAPINDPAAQAGQVALEKIILPVLAERKLAFAMMIGSRRGVNPALKDAADMGGLSDVSSVARLCAAFPNNKFFVTMLARENQHELAVAARKFGNLMIFGCWWFLNNPCLIEEITRMRLELLGSSMIPQHSDARVLDQLLYKWEHSRQIIGKVLAEKYADTAAAGWPLTADQIKSDIDRLFRRNFEDFLTR